MDRRPRNRKFDPNGPAPSAETQARLLSSKRWVVCNKNAIIHCSHCKCASWCSRDCLVDKKRPHDLIRKAFVKFLEEVPRPAEHKGFCHKLGALFPEKSTEVQFVWVEVEVQKAKTADDGVDKKTIIPVDSTRIWRDKKAGFDFDHTINPWFRDEFMMDGSEQNKYVDNLLDGKRKRYWRGLLLVISGLATKSVMQSEFILDVIPSDVHRGGQYFATTGPFADGIFG